MLWVTQREGEVGAGPLGASLPRDVRASLRSATGALSLWVSSVMTVEGEGRPKQRLTNLAALRNHVVGWFGLVWCTAHQAHL